MPLKVFSQNKNTTFLNILIRGDIEQYTINHLNIQKGSKQYSKGYW